METLIADSHRRRESSWMEEVDNSGDWRSEFMPDVMKIRDLSIMDYSSSNLHANDQLKKGAGDTTCAAGTVMEDYNHKIFDDMHSWETSTQGSVDATTGLPSTDDWKEEIYQKIQSMKEAYLPELRAQYEKASLMIQKLKIVKRRPKLEEQFERLKSLEILLQCYIQLLLMGKDDIQPEMMLKEKLKFKERRLKNLLTSIRSKRTDPSLLENKNKRDPLKLQYPQQCQRPGVDTQSMRLEQKNPVLPLRPKGAGHHGVLAPSQVQSDAVGFPGSSSSPVLAEISSLDENQADISTFFSGKSITTDSPLELSYELEYAQMISNMHSREAEIKGSVDAGSVDAFVGLAGTFDWRDEVYQTIQYMKVAYLEELLEYHEKICLKLKSSMLLGEQTEHIERLKKMKSELDGFIGWLNVSKECIVPLMKAKLSHYDRRIMNFISSQRRKTIASGKLQDQNGGGDTVRSN